MLTAEEIEDAKEEWLTGRLKDGTRSPRVGWTLDKKTGELKRPLPSCDLLASFLVRPEHMVRVYLEGGSIKIETEERDEKSVSKGSGVLEAHVFEPEDKEAVTYRGITIAKRLEVGQQEADRLATIAAKEALYAAEQLIAKTTYEETKAALEEARKQALASGVEIDG